MGKTYRGTERKQKLKSTKSKKMNNKNTNKNMDFNKNDKRSFYEVESENW